MKQHGSSSKKLNIKSPCDSAIPFLGVYLKEIEAGPGTDICMPTFIAAVFTIVKRWKQHKCPSMGKWRNKMWCIHTMEYYSA